MTSASYTINGSRYFDRSHDRTHTASTGVFFALATSNAATTARDALAAPKSCDPDKIDSLETFKNIERRAEQASEFAT
jgi:hypothetical protein